MTEDDVDPDNPRPTGHYPRFADNEWHYVPDELAQTISLGPAGDGESGQDWVLTYTPEKQDEDDREKVLVRLTLRALHELYIETKDLSNDARMHGHNAECDLCGEMVDFVELHILSESTFIRYQREGNPFIRNVVTEGHSSV